MRKIDALILSIILSAVLIPSLVLAQDGSMPPLDGGAPSDGTGQGSTPPPPADPVAPSDPAPTEQKPASTDPVAESPRPLESASSGAVVSPATSTSISPSGDAPSSVGNGNTPTPAPAAAVVPVSAITEPTALSESSVSGDEEAIPASGDEGSPFLFPIIAALAVVPFGFLVAGVVKKKKIKTEDEEGGRCFDLKTILDEKLEELTDLKGKVKEKAVSAAKETVREMVEGTSAGEVLVALEKAEKEYNRIKKLYEECMIDFGTGKRAIIIHSCCDTKEIAMNPETRTYDKQWIPWVRKALASRSVETEAPLMPSPWAPEYEAYKVEFEKQKVDEHTILIGHSCGTAFLVRWLGETKQKIAKLVLVAPWKVAEPGDALREAFYGYDIDPTIKERVKEIVMFTADNERPDGKKSLGMFHEVLGGKIIELPGRGHYLVRDMKTEEFPELVDEIAG